MKVKNVMLLVSALGFSLIILEVGLRWFTVFPIHSRLANRVYDERLGYRMTPHLKGIDKNGFRNKETLTRADIVTIGDSHTYGNNVSSEESWPQQLALMTNNSVYNFGVGGYGILQYSYLIDEAIKLNPKQIIMGLYLANDLAGTCKLMKQIVFWQNWAKERGFNIEACINLQQSDKLVHPSTRDSIKSGLIKTAIGSLIAYYSQGPLIEKPHPNDMVVINDKMNKTIIRHEKISRHMRATDLTKTRIALSFEITKAILLEAKRKADSNNIKFSIVFIPSKENVFFDYLIEKGYKLPIDYYTLISNERTLVEQFSAFLRGIGVEYVDARPYVVQELNKSGNVYRREDDGHPVKTGYNAYAKAVYENIIFNGQ
jgi:lysophospholipase L1-like esterase